MTTTNKGLIQPANGSYVDTWDQPVNNDWSYIDAAFGGVTSLNATGVSAVTLTLTQYQPMAIAISGAMSNNVTYTIPSGVGGNWIVRNTTTDATGGPWTVTFASGGGGSTVTVIRSVNSNIWSDGTNMYFSDSRPAAAAGSNTQVQYNSSGFLGGANVYYNTQGNLGVGDSPTTDTTYKWIEAIGPNSTTGGSVRVRTSGTEVSGTFFNNNLAVYSGSDTAHPYILRTNAVEAMRIDTSGNVGIGTTSPTQKLDVNGSINVANNMIVASGYGYNFGPTSAGLYITGNTTTNYMAFNTSSSERMRIDTSGYVGIGTASPAQKLDVSGFIKSSGFFIGATGTGGFAALGTTGSVSDGGNFVGRSATSTFNQSGVEIYTNGSERMRIDSSGNSLVGYTSSNGAYKLQVNSQIFATSATIATSDARYKQNVQTLNGALNIVKALRPVSFDWKKHPVHAFDTENTTVGFLAQEVQQVLADKPYLNSIIKKNECVIEPEVKDENGDVTTAAVTEEFLGIAEGNMIAILTSAIQELSAKVAALEANATMVA